MPATRTRPAVLFLALAVLAAGCLGGTDADDPPADTLGTQDVPAPFADGGGAAPGPAAPKTAFTPGAGTPEEGAAVVHPYTVPGQTSRPPVHLTLEGVYDPEDCTQPASWFVGEQWQAHDLTSHFEPGDAVIAGIELRFTNADTAFADLHLWVDAPNQFYMYDTPVASERGEIVERFDFQFAYPTEGEADFFVGVGCWYAVNVEPIPYTIDVHLVFAEGVIPAGAPHLVPVSENVKELRVTGAPDESGKTVTGHYRVFGPDDALVGEFALNSNEDYDAVPVDEPGDYVIIVDHSENGMLALGADAPPADPALRVLDLNWEMILDYTTDAPGPVDVTFTETFPRVPLGFFPWIRAKEGGALIAKKVIVDVENARGLLAHREMAGSLGTRSEQVTLSFGIPPLVDEWAWQLDHHKYAEGDHTFHLQADFFDGELVHWHLTYLRPGETGAPPPSAAGG